MLYPIVGCRCLPVYLEFRHHHPNHHPRKKEMKPYAFLALVVAITAFIGVVAAIEAPRKPKGGETVHVLPRVEDMPSNPNPLSF